MDNKKWIMENGLSIMNNGKFKLFPIPLNRFKWPENIANTQKFPKWPE